MQVETLEQELIRCPLKPQHRVTGFSSTPIYAPQRILCAWNIMVFFFFFPPNSSISFSETARADAVLGYLIAFLVLLSTVKLWHLLRLNPKLNMITSTLRRAWGDISGFITVIAIMFLAYSIAVSIKVLSLVCSLLPGAAGSNQPFLNAKSNTALPCEME